MNNIQLLIIRFKNDIDRWEIPLLRGAVINALGEDSDVLYHNHMEGDKFRYSYPLVQYKRISRRAAIVCVGEGTKSIGSLFSAGNYAFRLGKKKEEFEIDQVNAHKVLVQVWNEEFRYSLRKWLPLNSDNYKTYTSLEGVVEKTEFLQTLLVGNILSFCKGLGVTIDNEIKCKITQIMNAELYTYKGVKLMGFDVEFKCNVSLPDFIGLGKGVSVGFGMVVRVNN